MLTGPTLNDLSTPSHDSGASALVIRNIIMTQAAHAPLGPP